MKKRVNYKHLPHKSQFHDRGMDSQCVLPRLHPCARLEDRRQGELIGQRPPPEHETVKAERFLWAVAVRSNEVVPHDPVRVRNSVEQVAGVAEGAMSWRRRERAVGGEEQRHSGAVDEDVGVGVELVELPDGATLAQQLDGERRRQAAASKAKQAWVPHRIKFTKKSRPV
jgi:hypothetical protein